MISQLLAGLMESSRDRPHTMQPHRVPVCLFPFIVKIGAAILLIYSCSSEDWTQNSRVLGERATAEPCLQP